MYQKFLQKNVVAKQVLLKPQEVLFIPTGWLVVESTVNSSFIYGSRMNFFTANSAEKFKEGMELVRGDV